MKERRYKMSPFFAKDINVGSHLTVSMTIVGRSPKGGRIVFELNDMEPYMLLHLIKKCIVAMIEIRSRAIKNMTDIQDAANQ